MTKSGYTFAILIVFVLVAALGMPLMMSGPMHHGVCPFMSDDAAICSASTLFHIKHWQNAFTTILVELLLLCGLILALFGRQAPVFVDPGQIRWRARKRVPDRPTLFQELYKRGILNRKEPHLFFVTY